MNPIHTRVLAAVSLLTFLSAAEPPSTATADSVFTLEKLNTLIPADAKLKRGSKWDAVGTAIATQALKTNALGKQGEFTVKVALQEPHPYDGHAIVMHSKPVPVKINGVSLPSVVYAYFDADSLAGIGGVRVGDNVTISGVLNRTEFQVDHDPPRLFFELIRARLKQPQAK